MPTNLTKVYKDMALDEALERADADGRDRLGPVTQSQYLGTLREMLDLALKKRLVPVNQADGLKPLRRDNRAPIDQRPPFTLAQLAAFFRSKFYRDCAASGLTPYRHDKGGGWRSWLPLLMLFTGLRPRELTQMHISDVQQTQEGIWFLDVVATAEDEEGAPRKTLKTAASKRKIPLHPVLLKLGFLTFVKERASSQDHPCIFSSLKPNKYDDNSWYALKRFNETFLPKEMPDFGPTQTFYSLRHSFRDGLRAIDASHDVLQAVGWSQGSRVSDRYGSKLDPDQLFAYISELNFAGVDLTHLYDRKDV